ncbi:hypothetical protein RhiirA1_397459 [Rhizophagus irregularis]|uniref:Uncharacterized protein n=1 Tax=Rhizophagus irregularis TaxID=588596 RepID=A0A2N0RH66_9GLOM|nr:hypothetical protein RhiirA1_397459 [Rhizophagus irregularis]
MDLHTCLRWSKSSISQKHYGEGYQGMSFLVTDQMVEVWKELASNSSSLIKRVLAGPMGVGKSYLAYFLASKAYSEAPTTFEKLLYMMNPILFRESVKENVKTLTNRIPRELINLTKHISNVFANNDPKDEDVLTESLLRFPDVTLNVTNLMGEQKIPWSLSLNMPQNPPVLNKDNVLLQCFQRHPRFDFILGRTFIQLSISDFTTHNKDSANIEKAFSRSSPAYKHVHMTRETNIWIVLLVVLIKLKSTRLGNS